MADDVAVVWAIRKPKAKKDWRCWCCSAFIPAKTTYTCYAWVLDGTAGNDRYHDRCAELLNEIVDDDGHVPLGQSINEAVEGAACITEKARSLLEKIFGQQRAFELLGQQSADEDDDA